VGDYLEIVFELEKSKFQEVKDALLKNDEVSKASVKFREGDSLGLNEKYYCYISGSEEICEKSKELVGDLCELVTGDRKKEIIKKIKEEEEKALEGFGGIFG